MKPAAQPRRRSHRLLWALLAVVAATAIWLGLVCVNIERDAGLQELHSADAIVVFGAAEYSGRPSPVYKARLDHAFALYQSGLAPVVITTGGSGGDPSHNEGQVGHDYLMHLGVPEANLIAETHGSDTAESASRIGVIMRTNGIHTVLAVSDGYHVFRIRKMLEHEGVRVYVAPRPDSRPRSKPERAWAVMREATSYFFWRLRMPV